MNLKLTIKVQGEVSHITLVHFPYALLCTALPFPQVRKFSRIPSCNYPVFALPIWVYHLLHTYALFHLSPFLFSNDIRHHSPIVLLRNMKYYPVEVFQHNLELWSWLHYCAAAEPNMLHKCSIALHLNTLLPVAAIWESPTGGFACKWG